MINKPLIRPYFRGVIPGGGGGYTSHNTLKQKQKTANLSHVPLQVTYKILCLEKGNLNGAGQITFNL